ncbi:MAG: T9SS type A sorting domain-containing protein [Flavobacteriales bacterium]|nr:T9SS type A sorting domain-containing protein [Flavobacteriales bacterium]
MYKTLLSTLFIFVSFISLHSQNCETITQQFGVPIPDNNETGAIAVLPVSLSGNLGTNWYLDSVKIQISHTYVGDIKVSLISSANDTAVLFDRPGVPTTTFGCGNDNVNAVFSDVYTLLAEGICLPNPLALSGGYKPITTLQTLHTGQPVAGNWKLFVQDLAGGDLGIIDNVTLYFTPIWYSDADNDSYGSGNGLKTCVPPARYVFNNADCNDDNPQINPSAMEICGNKIDEDCSGFDTDYLYQPVINPFEDNVICEGEETVLLISPYEIGDPITWFYNQNPLTVNSGNFLEVSDAGIYSATVLMTNGCLYFPAEVELIVNPLPEPQISLTQDGLFAGNYFQYTWYLNGVAIPTANDAYWWPQSNGLYTVAVTDAEGCSGVSASFELTSAGVQDFSENTSLFCFPNPTSDFIYLTGDITENETFHLYDIQGKRIQSYTLNLSPFKIDIRTVAQGTYILQSESGKQALIIKQ